MNSDEFKLLDDLLERIRVLHGWSADQELTQRDFDFLIDSVFLKTKTQISLSTLKRIWTHNNEYMPRVSTLDILCQYVDFESWSAFKVSKVTQKSNHFSNTKWLHNKPILAKRLRILGTVTVVAILSILLAQKILSTKDSSTFDKAQFSLNKIVGSRVPLTVVFNYDLSDVKCDSAFIQLSWNALERFPVSENEHVLTSTYYYPGIHQAKLILNDSIALTHPVYLEYPDWLCLYRQKPVDVIPVYIETEEIYNDGVLYANPTILNEFKADTSLSEYYVSYIRSQDFGVSADEFTFKTRIKNPTQSGQFYCQTISIYIYAENGGVYLTLCKPGCAENMSVVIGDKILGGQRNDLSALGRNYSDWQEIRGSVHDNKLQLFLNDTLSFETEFKHKMGRILTWQYFFRGHGAVDYLEISDQAGETVFQDNF